VHCRILNTIKELKNKSFTLIDCASEEILVVMRGLQICSITKNWHKYNKYNARKTLTTF
jgi:hypothetical protein